MLASHFNPKALYPNILCLKVKLKSTFFLHKHADLFQTVLRLIMHSNYIILLKENLHNFWLFYQIFKTNFRSTDDELVFESPEKTSQIYFDIVKSQCETMADALKWSVAKHGNKPIMGTREIIAELDEVQPNGRMFKKYDLGDYRYSFTKSILDWWYLHITVKH